MSPYKARLIKLIVSGVIITLALFFSIMSSSKLSTLANDAKIYLIFAYLMMGLVYMCRLLIGRVSKWNLIRRCATSSFYLILMVLAFFLKEGSPIYTISACLFFSTLIVDGGICIAINHGFRSILLNSLKGLIGLSFLLVFATFNYENPSQLTLFFSFVPLSMAIVCFFQAMAIVFSGVKKSTVASIIKKTYAVEIIYGLVVLITITALALHSIEPNMSIGDALWYCFALVTTIGFGDVTAVTITGRVLSVILGIYGIIVVALITSIIVNFYNETKKDNPNIKSKDEQEERKDK